MVEKTYIAIDLKSFYASVECVERGLDPLKALLTVADSTRTSKTICLAVSPALKAYGIPGRCRLFELEQKARGLDYIVAMPRMALYIEYSNRVYDVYLQYFSPDDIHVYSVDEVFIDATPYLTLYKTDGYSLARRVIQGILKATGITATAGVAPNLYLSKIAMDIVAKHLPGDKDGVRIAQLDQMSYRRMLWEHQPITDFWRVGSGTAARLAKWAMLTMGDIARRSLKNMDQLYKIFGIDAEILIDHAWGYEPCTIQDVKKFRPKQHSVSSGQVLPKPYDFAKGRLIVREMAELLALDLFKKGLVTSYVSLWVSYEKVDGYMLPPTGGGVSTGEESNSSHAIVDAFLDIYDGTVDRNLFVRRFNLCACDVIPKAMRAPTLFQSSDADWKEENFQEARLDIIERFGSNAILKGMNFMDGAMTRERNRQIGGHRA